MRFLNPKTDFAFKRIFGSSESKDILLSFINAILRFSPEHEIVDLTIIDPYQAPKIKGMKDTYLDVKARSRDGREFIIEMQVLNVAGFEKRVLYNAAKSYSTQIESAEKYLQLNPVIAITITDFIMFNETTQIISSFRLIERNEFFEYKNSDLELVFVELPKFNKTEEQLADITDKWIYFLKNAGSLEFIPQTLAIEQPISKAFQIANKANLTREELDDQERREMFIQDQRGAIIKAIEQGLEQGRAQGLAQGFAQGREQGIQQGIARNLYDLYREGIISGEQAKAYLEKLRADKSLSEDTYQELLSKLSGIS
ncbi:MAG: Rpn family recombination-promoting nuclease/putative transposase [bacterium]|nr:Rpn family recombination-promoting nuclease/putative transposase [bacterium]